MPQSFVDREQPPEKAGVIVPWTQYGNRPGDNRMQETQGLVQALGCELEFIRSDNVRKPTAGYLLSGGLLERLGEDVQSNGCSIVVIDSALTPVQQRNLEKRLGVKVIDRTGLILEIFGLRALTNEGRLQVELARLLYERSRLVRTWTHLERQRGGSGFLGGPGETQLEADKRMLDRALARLKSDLEDVRKTRRVQREGRKRRDTPVVALVGYTNAGKSSLFNRLTGADVMAKDMPFATLDTTIRKLALPKLGKVNLVDTVGFISDLPTHLVDSFRATLEEALEADLLIHVRDRSSEVDEQQKQDVLEVLDRLAELAGAELPPIIEAWNKFDLLSDEAQALLMHDAGRSSGPPAVPVSAITGQGIDDLSALIEHNLQGRRARLRANLSNRDGALRAWLHENALVEEESFEDNGDAVLIVIIEETDWGRLVSQFPGAAASQFQTL
ncbi:MAG: GTPase HflX [Henriciella sp.]